MADGKGKLLFIDEAGAYFWVSRVDRVAAVVAGLTQVPGNQPPAGKTPTDFQPGQTATPPTQNEAGQAGKPYALPPGLSFIPPPPPTQEEIRQHPHLTPSVVSGNYPIETPDGIKMATVYTRTWNINPEFQNPSERQLRVVLNQDGRLWREVTPNNWVLSAFQPDEPAPVEGETFKRFELGDRVFLWEAGKGFTHQWAKPEARDPQTGRLPSEQFQWDMVEEADQRAQARDDKAALARLQHDKDMLALEITEHKRQEDVAAGIRKETAGQTTTERVADRTFELQKIQLEDQLARQRSAGEKRFSFLMSLLTILPKLSRLQQQSLTGFFERSGVNLGQFLAPEAELQTPAEPVRFLPTEQGVGPQEVRAGMREPIIEEQVSAAQLAAVMGLGQEAMRQPTAPTDLFDALTKLGASPAYKGTVTVKDAQGRTTSTTSPQGVSEKHSILAKLAAGELSPREAAIVRAAQGQFGTKPFSQSDLSQAISAQRARFALQPFRGNLAESPEMVAIARAIGEEAGRGFTNPFGTFQSKQVNLQDFASQQEFEAAAQAAREQFNREALEKGYIK